MQRTTPIRVQIGAFELHLKSGDLRQGAQRIHLQGQPFQILRMLVERAGELVTREEIKKKLWPNDTVVEFDDSIHTALKKLRQALGDAADNPKYVETVARRGYRLIVPVECLESILADKAPVEADSSSGVAAQLQFAPAGLTGRTVSHYRVLDVIGGGGMGVVYKAEDLKLGRAVALKFLPEELGSDPHALERFSREARAASSLDHPNICPIHEFGEHEGRPFMVMQLLEGQTLRDRLTETAGKGALPLEELLEIGIQVSDGLQAAHEKGIIHRDIKPANIFVTYKGICKILDFGLAKLLEGEQEDEDPKNQSETPDAASSGKLASPALALTRTGMEMGTAGYMSPEQARGEKLDARTDLFSFGLVLYEMATGQRAFTGDTAVVLRDAILNQTVLPVRELNSNLPAKLELITYKALQKDRERRYQSAAEMRAELERVDKTSKIVSSTPRPHRRMGVAIAAVIVAAMIFGGKYWQSRKTATTLTGRDTLVLAEFSNLTGDKVLNDGLRTALAVELDQSPFLNLLSDAKVNATLRLMNRPPNQRLTDDVARTICIRTNSRALVNGSIVDAGNRYRIDLAAVGCATGTTIARSEVMADERSTVVKALGQAGYLLRQKLGEPRNSLRDFSQPLDEAMTPSLEALQAYSQAKATGGIVESLVLLNRSVEFDPNFAAAHTEMGARYSGVNQASLAIQNSRRAFELRSRLTRRQRFAAEATYYLDVTGELDKAIQQYKEWIRTYPNDSLPHDNLGGLLADIGQYDDAVSEEREAVRLAPGDLGPLVNLMSTYNSVLRLSESRETFETAQRLGLDGSDLRWARYVLAFLQGDRAAMLDQVAWGKGRKGVEDSFFSSEADTAGFYGHMHASWELSQQAVESALNRGATEPAAGWMGEEAGRDLDFGEAERGRREVAESLALSNGKDVTVGAALGLAEAGDTAGAEKLVARLKREYPLNTYLHRYSLPCIQGFIELHNNHPREAIETLKVATVYEFGTGMNLGGLCPVYVRGLAYLKAGEGKLAAVEFQKMIDHRGVVLNYIWETLSHLQLGRAQVMMGDKVAARKSYQDFLTLWKDADPDIPIYQQAKAEYAKLL